MGRSLSPRWGSGVWLGRRWGTAAHIVAVSPHEVREVRAVARPPVGERWSRGALQELAAAPWMRRREPVSAGVAPRVIPHVAQE
eukprot:1053617-Alexandrium_andersonii.AAC.1